MTQQFHDAPDPELRDLLRREFEGPESGAFLAELRHRLGLLPDRTTEWDILAGWARPSVLVGAMAAGMALGFALWRSWDRPGPREAVPAVSAAMLEEPRAVAVPIVHAVMEAR